MSPSLFRRPWLAGGLLAVGWAQAQAQAQSAPSPQPQTAVQAAAQTARSDPLNAQAEVPPAVHASAFAGYRAAGEPQVGGWKEANQTVTRIGGWRVYAREASAPAPVVAPAAPAPAPAPSRGPAGHHHGHGKP